MQSTQNKSWTNLPGERTRTQRASAIISPTQPSKSSSKRALKTQGSSSQHYHHSVSNSITVAAQNAQVYPFAANPEHLNSNLMLQ